MCNLETRPMASLFPGKRREEKATCPGRHKRREREGRAAFVRVKLRLSRKREERERDTREVSERGLILSKKENNARNSETDRPTTLDKRGTLRFFARMDNHSKAPHARGGGGGDAFISVDQSKAAKRLHTLERALARRGMPILAPVELL